MRATACSWVRTAENATQQPRRRSWCSLTRARRSLCWSPDARCVQRWLAVEAWVAGAWLRARGEHAGGEDGGSECSEEQGARCDRRKGSLRAGSARRRGRLGRITRRLSDRGSPRWRDGPVIVDADGPWDGGSERFSLSDAKRRLRPRAGREWLAPTWRQALWSAFQRSA